MSQNESLHVRVDVQLHNGASVEWINGPKTDYCVSIDMCFHFLDATICFEMLCMTKATPKEIDVTMCLHRTARNYDCVLQAVVEH